MTKLHFDPDLNTLIITPELFPEDEDFELWATIFLHHGAIQIIEFSQGADRHQLRFLFNEAPFNLNYEFYSQSLWICPEGNIAQEKLSSLNSLLQSAIRE